MDIHTDVGVRGIKTQIVQYVENTLTLLCMCVCVHRCTHVYSSYVCACCYTYIVLHMRLGFTCHANVYMCVELLGTAVNLHLAF